MFKRVILLALAVILSSIINLYAKEDSYSKMAKELSEASNFLKQTKVAIVPFSYMDKRKSEGGAIIAERLTTRIVKLGKLKVIERQHLEKVFQELHFEMTEVVDVEATKQVGKILGVDAIITGSLMDVERNKVEVNARVIKTETAEVVTSSFMKIQKTWSDVSVTQAEPVDQPPKDTRISYQRPETTYKKKPLFNMFVDIFFGSGSGKMDLSFDNMVYPIDEIDLSIDIDGSGTLSSAVYYRQIGFSGMEMKNTSMPLGVRMGFFQNNENNNLSLGADLEVSYITQYLKKQNTSITLNNASTYGFNFFVNDYLKISTLTILSGDLLLQFNDKTFRPYIGLGLGMTINTVTSPYIYQYYGNIYRKPLNDISLGFLYRFPIGIRIMISDLSSLLGEFRISNNTFSFDRNIRNEFDKITMSFKQFFLGFSFSF